MKIGLSQLRKIINETIDGTDDPAPPLDGTITVTLDLDALMETAREMIARNGSLESSSGIIVYDAMEAWDQGVGSLFTGPNAQFGQTVSDALNALQTVVDEEESTHAHPMSRP